LLLLGVFFFASYGYANWVASRHSGVGTIVFEWERRIPLLAWTIVPYWLIDPLYAVSLFLCATRRALDAHALRLLAAQVIAVACFLLFPLHFSFERGAVDGAYGWMFDVLMKFDRPYNQAPALHIALLIILWGVYRRTVPRVWHWPLNLVFALIAVSVLTTWQHHFFDMATGVWLGWFCVWLFPDDERSLLAQAVLTRDARRWRLALRYTLAALMMAVVAVGLGGAWLWLLWVSGSLGLVATIYAAFNEAAFQKHSDGFISSASQWLLGPYFLGAWANSRWWTRAMAPADAVVLGVLLGRIPTRTECERLGVAAIVDVCAELPCPARSARYLHVPMLDLVTPRVDQIERASSAIEAAHTGGAVLVCCALGLSRSALAVAAWLMRNRVVASPEEAVALVRAARPAVVLGPAHLAALQDWKHWHAANGAAPGPGAGSRPNR